MLMGEAPPKRQLEPLIARFKNDEEMLEYFEMKAVDAVDQKDDEDPFFVGEGPIRSIKAPSKL